MTLHTTFSNQLIKNKKILFGDVDIKKSYINKIIFFNITENQETLLIMKILFSLNISNQRQIDFCNRILKILDNKDDSNDITLICKSQNHLSDYLYIPPSSHIKTEEAEIILTYSKTGLSHISQFARKSNIPIIHFINTEYLKDEYLSEEQQVEKIILCDYFNQFLESFFQKNKIIFISAMVSLTYYAAQQVEKQKNIASRKSQ